MDTSKTYIKQCENAKEIQDAYAGQCNSWFALKKRNGVYVVLTEQTISQCVQPCTIIWLPRQDQLQEMIGPHWADTYFKLSDWIGIASGDNLGVGRMFHSWEQLWLAFVMKKLYRKQWNWSDWVHD